MKYFAILFILSMLIAFSGCENSSDSSFSDITHTAENGMVFSNDYNDWLGTAIFNFGPCFPNPAHTMTTLRIEVYQVTHVIIKSYLKPKKVKAIIYSGTLQVGVHELSIDLEKYSSRIYRIEIIATDDYGNRCTSYGDVQVIKY